MHARDPRLPARPRERGFTLIEILIALLIGVFLMGALLTIVQTNRRVFGEQNQLAQLQDNERMALTMMADVIQSAGYFPVGNAPTYTPNNTLGNTLIAIAPFGDGESVSGVHNAAAPGDTIVVRYMTAGGDNILNCSGGSNGGPPTPAFNKIYVNSFKIFNGQLICNMNGTVYPLVGGTTGSQLDITNMQILYGVKANPAFPGNNVDTYMDATQVTAAALWGSVISVLVKLTFTNPLAATNPGQPATYTVQRVIGIMAQTGPT